MMGEVVWVLFFTVFISCFGKNHGLASIRTPLSPEFSCNPNCGNVHGETRGGNLTVTIVEITGVEDTDGWGPFAGLPDVYVSLEIGGVVRQTSSVSESSNPVWPDGGEEIYLGAQASGSLLTISVYDLDAGLEFEDDFIATKNIRVMDCSCFESDADPDAKCINGHCAEESWVPLRDGENCGGREEWPWDKSADPNALCLRMRMFIEPFRVDVVEDHDRTFKVTTASVADPGNPPAGHWGRMYLGNNEPIDSNSPGFYDLRGGVILQTSLSDKNDADPGAYVTIKSNLDARIYVFRKMDDYPYLPTWLKDENIWTKSPYSVTRYGDDSFTDPTVLYRAYEAKLTANQPFDLGYPGFGVKDDSGKRHVNVAMYVVVIVMDLNVFTPEKPWRSEFEKSTFFPLLIEMLVTVLPFLVIQRSFLRRIGWKIDRIESGILHGASQDETVNLISLVFKPIYQNGSKANIDFRRNLYYITLGARIVLFVPIASCLSYSFAMAFLAVPAAAGIAVFCLGIGLAIILICGITWERSGWRMSKARLMGFALGGGFVYGFFFLSVVYDMRVIDAGLPYSIFSLTAVGFTLNAIPLIAIFFLDNDQMHQAFSQLQRVVNKNSKINAVKNKFQALGTMGLKMALLSNKMRQEQQLQQEKEENGGSKKKKGDKPFGSLLGPIYTVDDSLPAFQHTDIVRRWFTGGKKKRKRLIHRLYSLSLLILLVYSIIVYAKCDDEYRSQGFGLSFAVIVLDTSLFALLRGPCMWETGKYVALTFLGRTLLTFFAGENWIVGVGLAYFAYGSALGTEIIDQRMRTFSSDRAGAIAYFGEGLGKRKRKHDVSAMPEFVLGGLSFVFLIALLAYVFRFSDDQIPTVMIGGQPWKAWIFGVLAFVVVTVNVVLGLATRALMLEREQLLDSKSYLMYKWFRFPLQLVALAELLVVMSGLLIYAITSSTFVFISAIFWPLIVGCCFKIYGQWVANDFRVFQHPKLRVLEVDDSDSEDDEDEDDGFDDDDDDEENLGRKNTAKKTAKAGGSDDDDSSEEDDDDDDDSESETEGRYGKFKQSMMGNISKLSDKIKEGNIKTKIGMPKVPFRKPMNVAQKVDPDKYADSDSEEEEKEESAENTTDAKENNEKEGDDSTTEGGGRSAEDLEKSSAEEGKKSAEDVGTFAEGTEDDKGDDADKKDGEEVEVLPQDQDKNHEDGVEKEEKTSELKAKKVFRRVPKFDCSFSKLKAKALALREARPKEWAKNKIISTKSRVEMKLKPMLKISDEEDPVQMTDLEALWYGKLTPVDYSMMNAILFTSFLVVLYGLVISASERSAWWGNTIWFVFFFVVFSFAPIRKYYGTQTISADMIRSFQFSMFLEVVGTLILFVDVLNGSVSHPSTLWLLLGLFLWPAILLSVVSILIWRDSDWKLELHLEKVLTASFKLFLFTSMNAFIFAGPQVGFILFLLTIIGRISIKLLQVWSANGFYLPIRFQYMLNNGLNAMAIGFLCLTLFLTSNSGMFFCLCLAFGSIFARILAELLSLTSNISKSTPLYFSQFIFPIYSLDPVTNDLVEQNQIGYLLYQMQLVLLLFGVSCIVFVDPLEVGVGIVAFAFVTILTMTSYLISRTPIWMASATLCVDEKELRESARHAREVFEKRRSNFEIVCDEWVQKDKQEARLNKFAAWNQTNRARLVEFEKRYAAREMVDVVYKAERKLYYDRLGTPRKDAVLDTKGTLKDAFATGCGPFSVFMLGGLVPVVYNMYKDPASLRRTRKKRKNDRKRVADITTLEQNGKFILNGLEDLDQEAEDDDELEGDDDQLDRLIDELGPGGDVLKIRVLDWDLTSANDDLGFVEIELDELEPDQLHINWYDLESSEKKEGTKEEATGKIQVQVEVANVFGEDNLQVRVVVMRARGLRAADNDGLSDPFCIVECGTFSRRTAVAHKTLDPDWTETRGGGRFTFPPTDDTLQVEIRDKDLLTSDFLGGVDVYLPDLEPGIETVQHYELEGGHGKTRATGEVKLALKVSNQVSEYGLKASKASLEVTVISAKGIRAADRGGTSDPFCIVKCGMDAFSTSVIKKTLTPKWVESYTFNPNPEEEEKGEDQDDAIENVDFLDCWKVYQQLPKLDVAMAREYYEEMRASTLFQMLVVVASEGRKSKEAILFQRFLREYRFKLLANKIEPPKNIFKSKSWATVDVTLVALWLLRLSPEQRDRFYALKSVFQKEAEKQEERRKVEDEQYTEHSKALEQWQLQWDQETGRKQLEEFERRRKVRESSSDGSTPQLQDEPELVVNAREMLREIEQGKNTILVDIPDDEEGKKRRLFQDPDFPASSSSISGIVNEYMLAGWKRADDINPNVELFAGGTDPDDVAQGILCNGWFLSAVSILAASGSIGDEEVDPLIDNLFITKSKNGLGAYAVRLYKNSQWQLVLVDDQFPILDERFETENNASVAFSHSLKFEEMWVSVLEKAYAKSFQTYTMLENGYVHHALKTLTGCDAEELFLLNESKGPAREQLWQNLVRFKQNGFLLGCGTISNNSANVEIQDSGLLLGSCYAIYQVRSVDGHRLIQLRNPPGASSEFKGDWSDNSPLWTTRLKKKLGWTNDEDDGTFWMSFDDFLLSFRSLYVCYYYDPNIWKFVKLRGIWDTLDKTAVGLPNKHNPHCKLHRNPQWVIDVQRPCDIHIKISQTLPDGSMVYEPVPFAALLIRTTAQRLRHVKRVRFLRQKDIVAWTGNPDRAYEKHMYKTLNPGYYVLLVGTYVSDMEGPFQVHIDTSFAVGISQLYPRPVEEEKQQVIKTETKAEQEIDVSKLSRKERIKLKLEQKFERVVERMKQKRDQLEVVLEKKFVMLDEKIQKKFGFDLKNILPKLHQEEEDSDDDDDDAEVDEEGNQGEGESKEARNATNAAIKDIMEEDEEDIPKRKESTKTPLSIPDPVKVESDWVKQYDPSSGQYYYWNQKTNVTQWEEPAEFQPGAISPEMQSATKIQAIFRGKQSRKQLN